MPVDLKRSIAGFIRPAVGAFRAFRIFLVRDMPRVMKNFAEHDGELTTCSLAFFLLISFIPISLVIITFMSLFFGSNDMAAFYIGILRDRLPSIDIEDLVASIDKIVFQKRYLALIWIPFLFWWGSFVFDIIERGLEKAFSIRQSRKYWKAKIRHFIIIVGIAFFVLCLTFLSNMMVLLKNMGIAHFLETSFRNIDIARHIVERIGRIPLILSSLTMLVINALLVFIIYRFVPPKHLTNRALIKGALFASTSYEIVKTLFSYYITEINDYTSIFGSLNTIVILMIWIWYTCFLFIFGAEMAWIFYERELNPARD